MDFILQRFSDNRDCTLGLLFSKTPTLPHFESYTLEDEQRVDKLKGETRIPAGFYELKIRKEETPLTLKYRAKYNWFQNHIEITNVNGFKGVYIHIGNNDENTDGCILLGDNADNNNIGYGSISNSTQAFSRWYKKVFDYLDGGGKVTLEIRNEDKLK